MKRWAWPLIFLQLSVAAGGEEAGWKPNGRVVLLTDYGTKGFYLGAFKGAIYSVSPDLRVDSITNRVDPFNVRQGAFCLREAAREYPPGTVFVCVVDPGVGTERAPLAARTRGGKIFVGPDNGLLSPAIEDAGVETVRRITNRALFRKEARSITFHGRDIFGPVGAHLASGTPIEAVGEEVKEWVRIPERKAVWKEGCLYGCGQWIDTYGNFVTNIPAALLEKAGIKRGDRIRAKIGDGDLTIPFVEAYAKVPVGQDLALVNSLGLLELAVNRGSFASKYAVTEGEPLKITPGDGKL